MTKIAIQQEVGPAAGTAAEPVVLALLDNLFFTAKLAAAASQTGWQLLTARTCEKALIQARAQQLALIVIDLDAQACQPFAFIQAVKADEVLCALPLFGFVSHVNTGIQQQARAAGCDRVLARSAFSRDLPLLLQATSTSKGTLQMANLRQEKVNFKTLIRVAPERCFDALATGAGLDEWFTHGATVDLRPGGAIQYRWQDWGLEKYSGEIPGQVVEAQRPGRYVFQWRADSGTYNTTVEITFTPVAEGTIVHLIETGYEDTPAGMQDLLNRVSGWAQVLTLLKFYLEHGLQY